MAVKETILPTNPADIEKINQVVDACATDMQMITDSQARMRESVKELSEEHNVTVKHLNKMIKTHHKRNYDAVREEDDIFQALYETVLPDEST